MIEVIKVTLEDEINKIVAAIQDSSWSKNSEIDPSDYSFEHIEKSLKQDNHLFCIAYRDGQFAGMASAFALTKPDGDKWLYVNEVDVPIEKQRNGVGTELMKFLQAEGKRLGCIEMWLGTEKDNTAANALYNSLQPDEVEEFIGYTYKFKP
jgi:ribosomal protein S18 acetylase RimI-like enzyme